jgi:hypothetical protein
MIRGDFDGVLWAREMARDKISPRMIARQDYNRVDLGGASSPEINDQLAKLYNSATDVFIDEFKLHPSDGVESKCRFGFTLTAAGGGGDPIKFALVHEQFRGGEGCKLGSYALVSQVKASRTIVFFNFGYGESAGESTESTIGQTRSILRLLNLHQGTSAEEFSAAAVQFRNDPGLLGELKGLAVDEKQLQSGRRMRERCITPKKIAKILASAGASKI